MSTEARALETKQPLYQVAEGSNGDHSDYGVGWLLKLHSKTLTLAHKERTGAETIMLRA